MMFRSLYKTVIGKVLLGSACLLVALWAAEAYAQTASDSVTVEFQYGIDQAAPSVPTNVTAVPIAETQIDVAWSASTDDFGVAGYQVFRDGSQVATTPDTNYSDVGLLASTTYSYTIRAFDAAGNVSSSSLSVATTTFAVTPSSTPTSTEDTRSRTNSTLLTQLLDLQITAGSHAAELTFSTNQPVRYVLRYGTGEALSEGIIESVVYKSDHTIVLSDLTPDTRYQYELYVQNRFNQETLLQKASFSTTAVGTSDAVLNVDYFVGSVIDVDVVLRWRLPEDPDIAFVRVVRNSNFFPQSPTDGVVIYEGSDTAYADIGALTNDFSQYYTIFAYNLSGQYSSGRTLRVDQIPSVPDVVDPDSADAATDVETAIPPIVNDLISGSALSIWQSSRNITLQDRQFTIVGDTPFRFRFLADAVPQFTRSILVTIFETNNPQTFFTYVLRHDPQTFWYEARLPGLATDQEYTFIMRAYTVSGKILDAFEGAIITTTPDTEAVADENITQIWVLYSLVGGLLVLMLLLFTRYLLGLLGVSSRRTSST